ncbi:hypothetical protein R6Z07M_009840 [Ovis aries]
MEEMHTAEGGGRLLPAGKRCTGREPRIEATQTKTAASRRCGERERKAKPRGSCLTRAGLRRRSLQAGDGPWRDATRDPREAAPLPPATHACAPHAASVRDLGRGTIPGPCALPPPAAVPTHADTWALVPGKSVAPEPRAQASPEDLRMRRDASASGPGRGSRPRGFSHSCRAPRSGSGGGERWLPAGGICEGPDSSPAPPSDFLRHPLCPYLNAGPNHIRSASRVAVTAWSGDRRNDQLAPPPEAAGPRRDEPGCPIAEGRGGERTRGEGRGPGDGASPLLPAAPLPPPPPFSPVNGPLGLGTGHPAVCTSALFSGIPLWTHSTFSRLLVPKVLGLRRCLTRKDEAHKRCWGNLLYSPTPQTSAGFSAGGPSIREFRSLPHTVSLFPFTAVELKSCTFLIQRPK